MGALGAGGARACRWGRLLYRIFTFFSLPLRDMDQLRGACGHCTFRWACGGSRARAYAMTGDVMETDPFCEVPGGG